TNRLSLADLPADVHPKTKDGFVLHRKGQSLAILGKINRGVLYGVYDFLEQELGVRFLNADHTYVPRLGEVSVKLTTRTFDPPFEYRQLIYTPGPWSVRSRLNGSIYYKSIAKEAAGTFFVGRFVHTMGQL